MNETATPDASPRELAYRENDGLRVKLFWDEHHDRLTVAVVDRKTGVSFELEAARDRALDIFHHPYAYAASRSAPSVDLLRAA
jgi:hypothetical protein